MEEGNSVTKAFETYLDRIGSLLDELRDQGDQIDVAASMIADCIGNDGIGDIRAIIDGFGAGYVLGDFSPASLEAAIMWIDRLAGASREALRERTRPLHDMERAVGLYDRIYRRLA